MKHLLLFAFTILSFGLSGQLNVSLLSNIEYESSGSDIWGYTAPDGSEYAIFGTFDGVSVVNVTDPENPEEVNFIDQQGSMWRDMKTWGDHAYVTSDQGGTRDGLLVIDLSPLPDSVSWVNINPEIDSLGTINTCHNLYIDEFGYAYLSGCNINSGGIIIFDVASTPGEPQFVSTINPVYSHDVYVRDNRAYSAEIYQGIFTIYDVTNKDSIVALGSQSTPFDFTHNLWLSDDGHTLFTSDELPDASIASYDITDLEDIKLLDEFRPAASLGSGVIPHNVHVLNDYLVISYYTDGLIIVDASRPDNLVEVGQYDTYPFQGEGFNGAWGAYPFLPSGNILIGDVNTGLYVLGPEYKRAAHLEGEITDEVSGMAINNATISSQDAGIIEFSQADGVYKTGTVLEGVYEVIVNAFGYQPEVREVTFERGVVTMEDFQLEPLPRFTLSSQVLDKETGNGIPAAKVSLLYEDMATEYTTDENGELVISDLVAGEYELVAGKWGYLYTVEENLVFDGTELNPVITVELEKGIEDIFSVDLGWQTAFQGFQGEWERADPIGQAPAPGITIAPEDDSDDTGREAYVTGNAVSFNDGFLFGVATLRSPKFDLTEYEEPEISYQTWFWASNFDGDPSDETMIVYLSNGTEEKAVDTISMENHVPFEWNKRDKIRVSDYFTPTADMQLRVQIAQGGFMSAVEGGFDAFSIQEAETSSVSDPATVATLAVHPNPSETGFYIAVPEDFTGNDAHLTLYDISGVQLTRLPVSEKSEIYMGGALPAGVYVLILENNQGQSAVARVIKK